MGALLAAAAARSAAPDGARPPVVQAVGAVGLTVADLDRAVGFYTRVLGFEPVGDVEVGGEEVERLQRLFGLRVRIARLRLGEETLELTEYLAPRGRPIPIDSRSHDRWFQHVAIMAELFDGDPPFTPRGCIAQARGVAETLRAWLAVAVAEPVAGEPTGRREFGSA